MTWWWCTARKIYRVGLNREHGDGTDCMGRRSSSIYRSHVKDSSLMGAGSGGHIVFMDCGVVALSNVVFQRLTLDTVRYRPSLSTKCH